jgi:hypothetical protein
MYYNSNELGAQSKTNLLRDSTVTQACSHCRKFEGTKHTIFAKFIVKIKKCLII